MRADAVHRDLDDVLGDLSRLEPDYQPAAAYAIAVPLLRRLDPAGQAVAGAELLRSCLGVEAEQLRRWLAESDGDGENTGRSVALVGAATIRPERTTYVWAGRIVAADLNLLVGAPGVGKGTITAHVCARLTRGDLGGEMHGTPAAVVIASAEDHPGRVIVPRLLAAGADLALVHIVRVSVDGIEDGLTLPDDVPALAARVEGIGAALVIVDPIAAHLSGGVDSHRDASIRRALAPLARMAHETGAAVVGVAHTNKAQGTDWVRRIGGSVGLGAAARNVLLAADDPDGDDRLLVHAKSNTGALAQTLRYRIEGRDIEHAGEAIDTCGVAWRGVADGVTAADVLADREPSERGATDEAAAWLKEYLRERGGEAPARECMRDASRDLATPKRTLQSARRQAGIETAKSGGPGSPWLWRLPNDDAKGASPSETRNVSALAPYEESVHSSHSDEPIRRRDAKAPSAKETTPLAPLAGEDRDDDPWGDA